MSLSSPTSPLVRAATLRARKSAIKALEPGYDDEGQNDDHFAADVVVSKEQSENKNVEITKDPSFTVIPRGGDSLFQKGVSKSPEDYRNEALKSILNCYKFALGAGTLGVASWLYENRQIVASPSNGAWKSLPLLTIMDFFISIHQIIFGIGLFQAFKIFKEGTKGGSPLNSDGINKVGAVLCNMWGMAAFVLCLDAWTLALSLDIVWIKVVTLVLLVVNIPICRGFHEEVILRNSKQLPGAIECAQGRNNGFDACLNMLFCGAALAIGGLVDVVEVLVNFLSADGWENKIEIVISGAMDISESVIVVGLLMTLYHRLIRATITSTQKQKDMHQSAFVEYFQAQTKFYSRVGEFFAIEMLFKLLPYLFVFGKALVNHEIESFRKRSEITIIQRESETISGEVYSKGTKNPIRSWFGKKKNPGRQ